MTDSRIIREYFTLDFVPSVLSHELSRIGILLRELEVLPAALKLRFIGAKFIGDVQDSRAAVSEVDQLLIGEAIKEIRQAVKRANESGEQDEFNSLLQVLLNANSGLCAVGPHPCLALGNPEEQLHALFEGLVLPLT